MRPHIAVFDDFFTDPNSVLDNIILGEFSDVESPFDGVTYPALQLKPNVDLKPVIEKILGEKIFVVTTFARLTSSAQPAAPNQIHPDTVMSTHALLIYVSKDWAEGHGTSFWSHGKWGPSHDPRVQDNQELQRDSNDESKWLRKSLVQGAFNRALFYDSKLFHRAEPVGGFGSGPADGRIVLTCFFNILQKLPIVK